MILRTLIGIEVEGEQLHLQERGSARNAVCIHWDSGSSGQRQPPALHLHMILWLEGAPTSTQMKEALHTDRFQKQVMAYIGATIQADLDGETPSEVIKIKQIKAITYSQPVDLKVENNSLATDKERHLA